MCIEPTQYNCIVYFGKQDRCILHLNPRLDYRLQILSEELQKFSCPIMVLQRLHFRNIILDGNFSEISHDEICNIWFEVYDFLLLFRLLG